MSDKLCVCGHEMKPQGKQTLEMNGSSLGSNLWTCFFSKEEKKKRHWKINLMN